MGSIPRGIPRLSNECCGVENSVKLKVQAMNPGLVGFKYFLCFCIILHQSDHRILSTEHCQKHLVDTDDQNILVSVVRNG